jgi:hypothetical protein
MRTTTVAWMFGVVWLACVSGSHVKVFARMLGFNDFAFGLMAAVPFLATFAQILASVLIERTGLLKFQFLQCATIHRLCWLAVAAPRNAVASGLAAPRTDAGAEAIPAGSSRFL